MDSSCYKRPIASSLFTKAGSIVYQNVLKKRGLTFVVFVAGSLFALQPTAATAQTAMQPGISAQAPVQAPANSRPPTPSVSSYRINAGDQLEIFVWGEERLQRDLTVLPDGTIAFPLVGQLMVEGKVPQEVEQMVSDRLRSQYRGEVPYVTVSVKAPTGMRYSILGHVKAPGVFDMKQYLSVLEALSQAGGPDEFANVDNVSIIRTKNKQSTSYRVQLGAILKGGTNPRDLERAGLITIEPGDVIIVP